MERLNAADREAGVTADTPLTDVQKAEIAESRALYGARVAEREILFKDSLLKVRDPASREVLEREYRIDRERIEADRERAIEKIRSGRS
jgi:hypothetical protein